MVIYILRTTKSAISHDEFGRRLKRQKRHRTRGLATLIMRLLYARETCVAPVFKSVSFSVKGF